MKKKILAIGHSFVLAQNRDVLRALQSDHNFDVTIMAPRFFHGDLRDIHIEPEPESSAVGLIPIDCYGTKSIHLFAYNTFQIEREIKSQSYDAVYLWEEPYIVSGFTLAHIFHEHKIPYFFYSCQNIFKKYPWPFSYLEALSQKHASGMFACGTGVQEVLTRKHTASEILPFFVSLERFKPYTKDEKVRRLSELGLKEDFTFGFMGRLVEEKGLSIFSQTVDAITEDFPCNIIVIGAGPQKAELEAWAKTHNNVRVLTLKHDEVPEYLPLMDVMLCPSQTRPNWKEQFGRMIVEAFASGVVVVGSDSGEIPNVIGSAGMVVPENDLDAWIAAARTLRSDSTLRAEFAQRGFKQAQAFTVTAVAESLAQYLNDFFLRSGSRNN